MSYHYDMYYNGRIPASKATLVVPARGPVTRPGLDSRMGDARTLDFYPEPVEQDIRTNGPYASNGIFNTCGSSFSGLKGFGEIAKSPMFLMHVGLFLGGFFLGRYTHPSNRD